MNNYFLKILFIIYFLFVNNGNPFLFYQYQETNNEIFKTDVNEWQKMKPIIMKDYNLQVNNFNTIKEAIKLEMLDIIPRFDNNDTYEQYYQSGYTYKKQENSQQLDVYLYRGTEQISLQFQYFENISKKEIIDQMIIKSEANHIIIPEHALLTETRNFKQYLYSFIGPKLLVNNALINVSESRLIYESMKRIITGNPTDNHYIVYFNYFNAEALIPLHIYTYKEDKEQDMLPISVKVKQKETTSKVEDFVKSAIVSGITAGGSLLLIKEKIKALSLSGIANGLRQFSSFASINSLNMYNDFNSIDDISSVSSMDYDIFTELTTILPSRSSSEQTFFETTINSPEAPLNFLKQIVNEWVQYVKLKQQSMPFKKQLYFSSVVNSELLNKYFQSLTIKEFNHNLSYLRWGLFDRYRIGKLIDINSNFQVNIPLKNYKFLPPSLNMITKFKSAIANAFKSLVLRLEYIDTISNISQEQGSELLKRILWHYLDSGTIKIDNEIHYFSSDSFWIQSYNLTNNKLLVYLNHFLFMEPLKLEFSLYN